MDFTLTITSSDPAELAALLSGVSGGSTVKGSLKKVDAPTPTPTPATSSASTGNEGGEETVTLETLREKTSQLIQDGKSDEVKAILAKYGAKKVATLGEEHRAAYYADIKAIA